jgi:hypothetical protein
MVSIGERILNLYFWNDTHSFAEFKFLIWSTNIFYAEILLNLERELNKWVIMILKEPDIFYVKTL